MRCFLATLFFCLIPLVSHAEYDRHSVGNQYVEVIGPTHNFHVRGKRKPYRDDRGETRSRYARGQVVGHPSGCPSRAFCGCGAAIEVFGRSIRELWLARAWFKFPRSEPASGMVAVRTHHVFVLREHVGGSNWLVYDANSGRHQTRIHVRSIAGYTIVNPHGGSRYASAG